MNERWGGVLESPSVLREVGATSGAGPGGNHKRASARRRRKGAPTHRRFRGDSPRASPWTNVVRKMKKMKGRMVKSKIAVLVTRRGCLADSLGSDFIAVDGARCVLAAGQILVG